MVLVARPVQALPRVHVPAFLPDLDFRRVRAVLVVRLELRKVVHRLACVRHVPANAVVASATRR